MSNRAQAIWRTGLHGVERLFDAFRARPLGILVFLGSATLLLYLLVESQGAIRAEAVAQSRRIDHPARVSSFVTGVYVDPGDLVEAGTPLVDLSSHFIDRELARLDAEVEKLLHESSLAQARLLVEEQRWLDPNLRLRPDRPSLERPTEALFAKELAVLQTRRRQLQEDLASLTVVATHAGRVALVASLGTAVAPGGSVASLSPEFAKEIVAYVPSNTQPESIAVGAKVRIARPVRACAGPGEVLRRGATVEEAPGQLQGLLRMPVHGMPVYISVPTGCHLGSGQTLTVEFARSVM